MNIKIFTLSLSFALLAYLSSFSQGRKLYPGQTRTRSNSSIPLSRAIAYPWTWNVGVGVTAYNGQLNRTGALFSSDNYQFNAGLKYRFTNRFSIGGNLSYFRVSGDDNNSNLESGRKQRNLSFRTDCYQILFTGAFDFIPIITRFMGEKADQYERRNFFVPYGFGGLGFLYFNPMGKNPNNNEYVSLAPLNTSYEKTNGAYYSQFTPIVNVGVGCRIKVSEFVDVGMDLSYTKTFTDNLDDLAGGSHYPKGNESVLPTTTNLSEIMADKSTTRNPGYDPSNPNASLKGISKHITDGYFMVNFRVDYTMTSPFDFKDQRSHKHFGKGKGYKHHHFDSR